MRQRDKVSAVGDIEWRLVAEFKSFCSMHERLHSAEVEIHFSTSSIQYFHLFLFIIRSYSSLRFHFLFASNSLPVYASLQFQHIFSLPILFFIFCSFYSTAHFFLSFFCYLFSGCCGIFCFLLWLSRVQQRMLLWMATHCSLLYVRFSLFCFCCMTLLSVGSLVLLFSLQQTFTDDIRFANMAKCRQ